MHSIKFQSALAVLILVSLLVIGCGPSAQEILTPTSVPPTKTAIPTDTSAPTDEPTDEPTLVPALPSWYQIPIMPNAITGQEELGDYQFTVNATEEEIAAYYEQEMTEQGWQSRPDMTENAPGTAFSFSKRNKYVFFMIAPQGESNVVFIHLVQDQ